MRVAVALLSIFSLASVARGAVDLSFTGTFTQDDNVQLFNFVVGAPSNITMRTWSYAGGVNAAETAIARGGFDTILALFNSSGVLIAQNDDGGASVAADLVTGARYDTFLTAALAVGTYTVSVMQYNNFAIGPNISNGFMHDGDGNFTPGLVACGFTSFCDVTGNHRDGHWAFDILNVESATQQNPVPEPGTISLLSAAMLGCFIVGRKLRARV